MEKIINESEAYHPCFITDEIGMIRPRVILIREKIRGEKIRLVFLYFNRWEFVTLGL